MFSFGGRYSDILEELLASLVAVKELRCEFEDDYQGFVDVDAELSDGRVFSYKYWYGSCSGCDGWEADDLSDSQIMDEMRQECTIFDTMEQYEEWRKMVNKGG